MDETTSAKLRTSVAAVFLALVGCDGGGVKGPEPAPTSAKPTALQTDPPKTAPPKTEPPKTDPPKAEPAKAEPAKAEALTQDDLEGPYDPGSKAEQRPLFGPYASTTAICAALQTTMGIDDPDDRLACSVWKTVKPSGSDFTKAAVIVFGEPGISSVDAQLALEHGDEWWLAPGALHLPNSTHGEQSSLVKAFEVEPSSGGVQVTLKAETSTGGPETGKAKTHDKHVTRLECTVVSERPSCTTPQLVTG